MNIRKAIKEAKKYHGWNVATDKPTSVTITFLSKNRHPLDGFISSTELDLYSKNKENELTRLWNSLADEFEAVRNGILEVNALGYISDGYDTRKD